MNIELSKNIDLKTIEILAEVDFFKKSPYIELLEPFQTKEDLIEHLESENYDRASIENILKQFEKLGLFKNDSVIDLKYGFPEKEYGKYLITYCLNETSLPFRYKKSSIERENYMEGNRIDQVEKIEKELLSVLTSNDDAVQDQKFRIIKISDAQGIYRNSKKRNEKLKIVFDSENWNYEINGKKFAMENINLNSLFKGEWNDGYQAKEQYFNEIKDEHTTLLNFQRTYRSKIEIENYGIFEAVFTNIPLIPTENSYRDWFMYLLKYKISTMGRYITSEETEQIWNNVYSQNKQINQKYEIPYDSDELTKHYDKNSDIYWNLMTGKDLNPFTTQYRTTEKTITINEENNVDLEKLFNKILNLYKSKQIIIIDRYINTLRHFNSLKQLLKPYNSTIVVKIITTDYYETTAEDLVAIEEICTSYRIERIIRNKNEIPHDRYWILDNRKYYNVSKSIDFIRVANNGNVNVEHTFFHPIEEKETEPQVKEIIKVV